MHEAENRRTSHRTVPPETKKIRINEKEFILNDISREGIGVLIENFNDFFIGQRIASIFLDDHADTRPLVGIVNHMSQNDTGIICGIRFDFRNSTEFTYVETMNRAFGTM